MNSTSCSPGLQHIYYQQGLQGQKVVHLFKELLLKHYDTEGALQKCLKNLVDFCQQVIATKKTLQDVSSKKSVSKALSVIKYASIQFSHANQSSSALVTSDSVNPEKSKLIKDIVSSVNLISKVFFASSPWKESTDSATKEMRDLSSMLDKEDHTLYFDLDATSVMNDWQSEDSNSDYFSTPTGSTFIPLQGRHVTKRQPSTLSPHSLFQPSSTKKSLRFVKSSSIMKSVSFPEEEYCEILNRSSDLIDSAHKILLSAQKASPIQNIQDRSSLKILRQNLNEAIISFDISATSIVKDSENMEYKQQLLQNSIKLIDCMKNMRTFLKHLKYSRKAIKNKEYLQTIQTSHGSDTEMSTSSESLLAVTVSPSPSQISGAVSANSQSNIHTTLIVTGHPINTLCLKETTKLLGDAVERKDAVLFEKQVNNITDYQKAMKSFVSEIVKRKESNMMVNPLLQKSIQVSRQLIRKSGDAYRGEKLSKNDLEELQMVSKEWCKHQCLFVDNTWNQMSPWTKLLEPLFALKQYDGSLNKVNSSILNEWMVKFKDLNQSITNLSSMFQQTELSVDKDCVDGKASAHVQIQNSTLELREYATKLLQLSKLYLLDDVKPHEWLSFGLWLFRWANTVENMLHLIDGSIHVYEGHGFSLNRIIKEHEKWNKLSWQLTQSSQDPVLLSNLEKTTKDVLVAYKSFNDDFERFYESLDMKKARLILLLERWKLEIQNLSILIWSGTKLILKPVETLLATALHASSDDTRSPITFDSYLPIFVKKMERVRLHTCLAVDKATCRKDVHTVIENLDAFDETSERLLSLCEKAHAKSSTKRSLLSSIYSLQIQWLSDGNYLLYLLRQLPDVRYSAISALMRHMQTDKDMSNPYEFIDVIAEEEHFSENSAKSFSSWLEGGKAGNSEYDSVYSTWAGETEEYENISVESGERHAEGYKDGDTETMEGIMNSMLNNDGQEPRVHQTFSNNVVKNVQSQERYKPLISPKPQNYKKKMFQQQKAESGNNRRSTDCSNDAGFSTENTIRTVSNRKRKESVSKSIAAAARLLRDEANKWEDENNSIIRVVKLMAKQMFEMAEYAKGRGSLRSKNDLVDTAKAIAANAKTVAKFATIVAEECNDKSCSADLLHYAELIPTLSTQLRIVASVKSVNPNDETTDTMLIINAGNLMKGVVGTLRSAEAASIKISISPYDEASADVRQSVDLAFQWKRKVRLKRTVDAHCAPKDENGLRLSREMSLPSLADLVLSEDSSLYDLVFDKNKEY